MTEPSQETSPAPQLAVECCGVTVTLTVTCVSAYDALELYDTVCAGARRGEVVLQLETKAHAE